MKITAIATDNLPNRSMGRFPAVELPKIAQSLVTNSASVDHSDYYRNQWGTVTRAWVERLEPTAEQRAEYADVIAKEGYQRVMVEIESRPEIDVKPQAGDHLSITAMYRDLVCPGCDCEERDAFECPKARKALETLGYLDRSGVVDTLEISLVLVPAVKGAVILSTEV